MGRSLRRLAILVALAAGCSSSGGTPRAQLASVASWCCWLQAPDIDALVASPYAFVVMDYSRDGSAAGEFAGADIGRLRAAGKTALAYLSVGEAEDYRFYWDASWPFLADENPDWPGNYAVEYWAEEWWTLAVEPYLDRILAQGFDGVYLDRVDAYAWWHGERGLDARLCADRMAALVARIANHARARAGPGFVVCPQNGLSILDDASPDARERYLDAIDAVGVESLYYNHAGAEDQAYRLGKLAELAAAGKKAFLIEYVDAAQWPEFFARVAASGLEMVGYPAAPDRLLDELILAP
jgi:cysteinyl-tRNA synthetase